MLSGRPGLITEAMVRLEPDATDLEREVAEACHAATGGFIHDLRLVRGYVALALRNTFRSPRPLSRPRPRFAAETEGQSSCR